MTADPLPHQTIRVVLADSDAAFRQKVGELFDCEPDLKLLAGPLDTAQADIFLLSASPELKDTIAALERAHNTKTQAKIVLLVLLENQDFFVRAVRAGCRGILHKDSAPDLLLKCIRKVHEGELWLDRATTAQVLRQFTHEHPPARANKERDPKNSPLSPREREIVALVIQGYKNKELAENLAISEQTVKNHMHNIFDKLGVSDRLELALYAIHNNLHKHDGG